MKRQQVIWVALLGLYVMLFAAKHHYLPLALPSFMRNYLADLLFLPLLFGFAEWTIQKIGYKQFKIRLLHILIGIVWTSWFFEYFLPHSDADFTSDPADVGAYAIGALAFWLINLYGFTTKGLQ